MELPDLFFRWLLLGGGAGGAGQSDTGGSKGSGHRQPPPPSSALSSPSSAPSSSSFQPSVADMVALDPSLAKPFEALTDAVQSEDALQGLLDMEGLPAGTPPADYIAHMVRQTFLEPVQWQVAEVRKGFFRALPAAPPPILPRPSVLAEIVRGTSPVVGDSSYGGGGGGGGSGQGGPSRSTPGVAAIGGAGTDAGGAVAARKAARDFDFREAFAVYEDRDLVSCPPMHEVRQSPVGPWPPLTNPASPPHSTTES